MATVERLDKATVIRTIENYCQNITPEGLMQLYCDLNCCDGYYDAETNTFVIEWDDWEERMKSEPDWQPDERQLRAARRLIKACGDRDHALVALRLTGTT